MKTWSCVQFLKLIGSSEVVISDDEQWVRGNCPLAPFTHAKGVDENPSFGIKVNEDGESGYHCFTCGSGRLADLIHVMNFTTGIRREASDFYSLHENFGGEERSTQEVLYYNDIYASEIKEEIHNPIPSTVLDSHPTLQDSKHPFEKEKCLEVMNSRGISANALYKYGVCHRPYEKAIAFIVRGRDSKSYSIHYLSREEKKFWYLKPKYFDYPEDTKWGSKAAMFGLELYDPSKPLILVESETDLLRLSSLGVDDQYCILATCGTPTKEKISQLRSKVVYNGYDADATGSKYHIRTLKFLDPDVTVFKLDWSEVKVVDLKTGELRRAKDAGDLESIEQFIQVVLMRREIANQILLTTEYKDVWS